MSEETFVHRRKKPRTTRDPFLADAPVYGSGGGDYVILETSSMSGCLAYPGGTWELGGDTNSEKRSVPSVSVYQPAKTYKVVYDAKPQSKNSFLASPHALAELGSAKVVEITPKVGPLRLAATIGAIIRKFTPSAAPARRLTKIAAPDGWLAKRDLRTYRKVIREISIVDLEMPPDLSVFPARDEESERWIVSAVDSPAASEAQSTIRSRLGALASVLDGAVGNVFRVEVRLGEIQTDDWMKPVAVPLPFSLRRLDLPREVTALLALPSGSARSVACEIVGPPVDAHLQVPYLMAFADLGETNGADARTLTADVILIDVSALPLAATRGDDDVDEG